MIRRIATAVLALLSLAVAISPTAVAGTDPVCVDAYCTWIEDNGAACQSNSNDDRAHCTSYLCILGPYCVGATLNEVCVGYEWASNVHKACAPL